jgi:hypothetical protein
MEEEKVTDLPNAEFDVTPIADSTIVVLPSFTSLSGVTDACACVLSPGKAPSSSSYS